MIADGFYFSPDCGQFESRGGSLYFDTGHVVKQTGDEIFRYMLSDHGNRYSEWSDEQRSKTLAEYKAQWEKRDAELDQRRERGKAIYESLNESDQDAIMEFCGR